MSSDPFIAMQQERYEAAYTPDIAAEIDTESEVLADQLGISPLQAERVLKWHREEVKYHSREIWAMFGRVIGILLDSRNITVQINALAIAAGLDQLNGKRSQAEIARKIGCTRALLSHYVVGWADVLDITITKFRKSEAARETYQKIKTNEHRHSITGIHG